MITGISETRHREIFSTTNSQQAWSAVEIRWGAYKAKITLLLYMEHFLADGGRRMSF